MSHTYALLELTPSAFEEIYEKLKLAGYGHAFIKKRGEATVIDMHGIGVSANKSSVPQPHTMSRLWSDVLRDIIEPAHAGPDQIRECKRMFYLGAQMVMLENLKVSAPEVSEEEGVARFEAIRQELDTFYLEMEEGKQ